MLTSFFNKSKPINFIVVGLYMFLIYLSAAWLFKNVYDSNTGVAIIFGLLGYLLTMALINRIVKTNELTSSNTLTIFLFASLSALLPQALIDGNIVIANLLLITAVGFIIRLTNNRNIQGKIFNASLFIGLASLSYSWSIVLIFLVFTGIWYYDRKEYRNWLIPFIGLGAVAVLSLCFHLLIYDKWSFFDFNSLKYSMSNLYFQFSKRNFYSVGCFIIFSLIFIVIYTYKFKKRPARLKPMLKVFIWYYILTFLIFLLFAQSKSASLLLAATPLAVIGTSYLEMRQNKLVSEINLWILLVLPLLNFIF